MDTSDHRDQTVVIGGGPAGLTAAYELSKSGRPVVILEQDPTYVGGLSRTVEFKGFRFDIGGHRFFSKNQEIEGLWDELLGRPLEVRDRLSRIYFRGRFFKYPLEVSDTFKRLGPREVIACVASYGAAKLRRTPKPETFEEFMVAMFGWRLFRMFFKTYTEKVWGVGCDELSADWGAQRIRGLNLASMIRGALGIRQRNGQRVKALVDRFRYPTLGPGEVWQAAAARVRRLGGNIHLGKRVIRINRSGSRITSLVTSDAGREETWEGKHFLSTMPMSELVSAFSPSSPAAVKHAAGSLKYRDFVVVVMILDKPTVFPDQWIYVHEPKVRVARIQNFKNWSPAMVPDPHYTVLGFEYFCTEGDGLWDAPEDQLKAMGRAELGALGLANPSEVIDSTVVRLKRAYPVYDRGYREHVSAIREFLDREATNLQLIGRNGMHKYNNQDHAMMTGLMAARNIMGESYDLWRVNSDAEYLEEEQVEERQSPPVPVLGLVRKPEAAARAVEEDLAGNLAD